MSRRRTYFGRFEPARGNWRDSKSKRGHNSDNHGRKRCKR